MTTPDTAHKCQLLWKIARRHGWGSPIPKQDLARDALPDAKQQRGERLVEELEADGYLRYSPGDGYEIANDPDSQAKIAFRLRDICDHSELRIEATLSRFKQAGGFDNYDPDDLFSDFRPGEW